MPEGRRTVLRPLHPTVTEQRLSTHSHIAYFNHHGCPASRSQFPIQLAYALTIHKSQGLTLPNISVYLDESLFDIAQAYVALSRARRLADVNILSLNPSIFQTNVDVAMEYARLLALPQLPHW